tara:strand:- start:678 stop:1547 length:870 start_codon:yes stop_codon:yes gene_type:complete
VNHKKTLQSLIYEIITIEKEIGNGINFHKKISKTIAEFGVFELIANVFEENIKQKSFVNKKWTSCEIPQLTIFENEKITIKYHFFLPVINLEDQNASYLIHHHGANILSSHIFDGPGYQTIEFKKEIIIQPDKSFILKINKKFRHSNGSTNLLEDWTPHIIFNVAETSASIALWSTQKLDKKNETRLNYNFKNGKYYGITDFEFSSEVMKMEMFEDNSEMHIQAICYFMQKFNYQNNSFLSNILLDINPKSFWSKWLKKLKNNDLIDPPYHNEIINTLGEKIDIKSFKK